MTAAAPSPVLQLLVDDGQSVKTLAQIEHEAIEHALVFHQGVSAAARALGLGRSTIYRKVAEYGIDIERLVKPGSHGEGL